MKLLIFISLLPLIVSAQSSWEKVDAKEFMDLIRAYERAIPEGESYSLQTGYKIFNDYADKEPVQTFDGALTCKNGKELNVHQMGHLMIQDATLNITVDTAERQLLVQQPDPSFFYRKTVQDYNTFLKMAEVVYKKTVNGKVMYMLELKKGNPYRSMEFTFSDKNAISQIVIYSNQPYYAEGDAYSADKAMIVLDFKNFRKAKAVDFSRFLTIKDCILIKDNKITPIGRYKDFEVIDLRN